MSTLFELSSRERELIPTEADVRFYEQHGYFVTPPLFSAEELSSAEEAADSYYAGRRDRALPDGTPSWGWKPEDGEGLRKNDYASVQCARLAAFVRKPVLGAIAARLARVREIRLWHDQLLYKPPSRQGAPATVGWHTDRAYWKAASSERMLTAWIPFHDVDVGRGPVMVIDGSHRWPDNTGNLDFFATDLEALERRFVTGGHAVVKVPLVLRAGQVSLHHCRTIHGSGPNVSDRPRRSIAVHLQDGDNRPSGHLRPDGAPESHRLHQFLRLEDGTPDYADPVMCPVIWSEPSPAASLTAPPAAAP